MAQKLTLGERSKAYNDATDELIQFYGDELPAMGNWTPEKMVDMVGLIKIVQGDAEQIVKTLNGLIDQKLGDKTQITGDKYVMTYVPVTQWRINAEAAESTIKELLWKMNGATLADGTVFNLTEELLDKYVSKIRQPVNMSQHRYSKK